MSENRKYSAEEQKIVNFLLNSDEKKIRNTHFSEFSGDALRRLIKSLPEDNETFRKIMLLDYTKKDKEYLANLLFRYEVTKYNNEDYENGSNEEMAKKFFLNLIKTKENFDRLSSEDIGFFVYNYKDRLKDFFEKYDDSKIILAKMLTKYFIPKDQKELICNKLYYMSHLAKEIYNTNEKFIEIISLLESKEIEQINLSYVLPGENRAEEVLKLMSENDKFKNNLPKFNADSISKTLLYSLIKEGKITNSNIITDPASNLDFLKKSETFNIIREILQRKEGKTFFSGEEYNIKDLKNLAKFLKPSDIRSFAEAYCESYNPKILFKREDLDKILNEKVIVSNIDINKMIVKDYFDETYSKYLSLEGNEDGYKKNRQENLYFLILELKEKLEGRLGRLKNKTKETNKNGKRILELERDIRKLQGYFEYLSKFRNDKCTDKLCDQIRAEEILNFVSEKYSEEVSRRAIINYHRRIEPFVLENFPNEAEEITKNIEDALTVLFNIYSLGIDKMKAKDKLAENLKKIGDKYKDIEKKTFGSYLMLSSICNATNIVELSNAIYATIRNKMINDYIITQKSTNEHLNTTETLDDLAKNKNNKQGVKLNNLLLFRGYNKDVNDYKKFMTNTLAQVGRPKYNFWDMTYSYDNLNVDYGNENKKSHAGSFTSFSTNAGASLSESYGSFFISVYKIPKNFYKSFRFIQTNFSEFNNYDIPLEYRMFNVVFNNNDKDNNISSVQFNENMDFVLFKIKPTDDIEFTGKDDNIKGTIVTISKAELEEIILKSVKNKEKLKSFLNNNLIIERVFERDKILNNAKQQEMYDRLDENELKLKKTLEIENRIERMECSIKPFDMAKPEQSNLESISKERVMYAIPDTHGSYSSLKEDLIKIGVVIDDGRDDFIYYKKDDYGLRHPIYKEPKNNEEYIKVPYLTLNSDFDSDIVQLGDLIDSHSEKEERSLDCLATSILLSRQLKHNYTTLIGNHEITNFVNDDSGRYKRNNIGCKEFISEAVKNGEMKLLHYSPETNLVSSHVLLLKDNVINFLNETILKNMEEFKNYNKQIEKLTKILGLNLENGKYNEEKNKCLLDEDPADEENVKNFVDIINELFLATFNTGKDEIIRTLLGTLINENRFYQTEKNGMDYATNLEQIKTPEKVKNHIYKGLRIVMGHDITPFRVSGSQKQLLENATILLTDENQSTAGSVCFKITSDKYGENKYYSWKGYTKNTKDNKGFEEIGFLGPNKSFENLARNIKKLLEKNEKDIDNGKIIDINDEIKETIKRCAEFVENNKNLGINSDKIKLLSKSNNIRKALLDNIVELLKIGDEKTMSI